MVGDLPIRLDPGIRNLTTRVHAALRAAIIDGLLAANQALPSSRALAEQIGINRNAVVAAYEQLQGDGLIVARQGAGTFVAAPLPVSPSQNAASAGRDHAAAPRRAFALGHTETDPGLLRDLSRATSRAIITATPEKLAYGDPRGSAALRREVAAFLAASRGIRCDPACVMIVAGTQSGLRLCMETLLAPGDRVWIEDPGYYAARATLEAIGLQVEPVGVDQEGLIIPDHGDGAPAKAVYVTPSHQFPTGVTMSMRRRVALLDWARKANAWIFEDDYDSEFRYAGPPLTALAGLGSERVIYSGTFTKTLFPSLRLAYLVLPAAIMDRVIAARASHDRFPPRFMQDAVAELMAKGLLARHIRRTKAQYRKARDTVAQALGAAAGAALDIIVPTQGLHMLAYLPEGSDPRMAAAIRHDAAVETRLVSETSMKAQGREGFILGISGHPLDELRDAATRLGRTAARHGAGER
ncbi:MAG: PLP-dependent aminotransferase family protein [Roseomonas sp.]|nr:PLP-dependent aminotransferase family protein [Roseomonas sp.]